MCRVLDYVECVVELVDQWSKYMSKSRPNSMVLMYCSTTGRHIRVWTSRECML